MSYYFGATVPRILWNGLTVYRIPSVRTHRPPICCFSLQREIAVNKFTSGYNVHNVAFLLFHLKPAVCPCSVWPAPLIAKRRVFVLLHLKPSICPCSVRCVYQERRAPNRTGANCRFQVQQEENGEARAEPNRGKLQVFMRNRRKVTFSDSPPVM